MRKFCVKPWDNLFIFNDGFRCCCDNFHSDAREIKDISFNDVWNGNYMVKLRNDMINYSNGGDFPEQCMKNCPNIKYDGHELIDRENFIIDKTIVHIDLRIMSTCNVRCKMCNLHSVVENKTVDYNTVKLMLVELYRNNDTPPNITVQGGEIFAYKESRDFLMWCGVNDIKLSYVTNLTVFDDNLIEFLGSTNSINSIVFSCDSLEKDVFEEIRYFANMEIFIKNYKSLKKMSIKHGFSICVNTIVMTSTYKSLKKIIEFFLDDDVDVNFLPIYTNTNDYENIFKIKSKKNDLTNELMSLIKHIDKKYNGRYNYHKVVSTLVMSLEYIETIDDYFDENQLTNNVYNINNNTFDKIIKEIW